MNFKFDLNTRIAMSLGSTYLIIVSMGYLNAGSYIINADVIAIAIVALVAAFTCND